MYLNKMIAIDVTDTYYAMHRRICRWLTSKRKERHAYCSNSDTRITLYIDAITYPISVISIHLSTVT